MYPRRWNELARPVQDRLDALLGALAFCQGSTMCSNPYSLLHPEGDVTTFKQVRAALKRWRLATAGGGQWHMKADERPVDKARATLPYRAGIAEHTPTPSPLSAAVKMQQKYAFTYVGQLGYI